MPASEAHVQSEPFFKALIMPRMLLSSVETTRAATESSKVAGKRLKTMSLMGTPLVRL